MNMNSAEFWRNNLSLLKLVLCQHKKSPSQLPFCAAAQTAALRAGVFWDSLSVNGALAHKVQEKSVIHNRRLSGCEIY